MIGFNLDFVADPSDPDAEDRAEEEEVEEVELEGSEIPLGSTTFAACFEARTLQNTGCFLTLGLPLKYQSTEKLI